MMFDEDLIGESVRGMRNEEMSRCRDHGASSALTALRARGPILRHTLAGFLPLIDLPSGSVPDNGPYARFYNYEYTVGALRALWFPGIWPDDDPEDVCVTRLRFEGWAAPDDDELRTMFEECA